MSRQEADNQITQDYVSHLTCEDPVSVLESGIQSTEEFFVCLSVREKKRQINSLSCSVFSIFFCISISLTHILSASFALSLAVTVSLHVGRDC